MSNTIENTKAAIAAGEISLLDVVNDCIKKIESSASNSFIETFAQDAIDQASNIEIKIKNGSAGKLAGLVIGLKDNICYKNHKVSAASKILENFESLFDATVTKRLIAEDAIIIGRLNCDEFAMGSANENSIYGPTKNPLDLDRVPGGSSGGSAAAVAEGLCHAALGTDTGGSVRQPASFCGVIGFKPTYGRISRHGIIAYGSSFDQVGIFAKNVADTALIAEVISGQDQYDATSSSNAVPAYSQILESDKKYKIAYFKDALEHEIIDSEISQAIKAQIERLEKAGHTLTPIEFAYTDYMVPTYYVLTTAEASSNLARYDGVHYGHRSEDASDTETTYVESRTEGFGLEVKRRIMTGTFVLSSGYYDAYYSKAQKVRKIITEETEKILNEFDFILSPTTPEVAFKHGEKSDDPIKMYLSDIFTVHANLTGIPAISVPLGNHSSNMPMSMQFSTKKFNEASLFSIAELAMN